MDRNTVRNILIRIGSLKNGELLLIDDLHKDFKDVAEDDLLTIVSKLATRYIIRIDGRYSMDCYALEKYNKIAGLEREGFDALDAVCNDKIWKMTEEFIDDKNLGDVSFITAIEIAKKFLQREIDSILKEN